ncbi:MAG: HWE histidine kinase domain-containing protein [Pseudolabrys sp.]
MNENAPDSAAVAVKANATPTMSTREMAHRINNTLAVVQSIINQTARMVSEPKQFAQAVNLRIGAIAAANRALLASEWDGADLETLVRQELLTQGVDEARLHTSGPRTALPARSVTAFALLVHELATNVIKHGALSGERGDVDLTWSIDQKTDDKHAQLLTFVWTERGGPPVAVPERKGFGSMLLDRGVDDCRVTRRFEPTGLVCTITLPL